ncbi:MAG: helix-turn-helix domain-containing protein [Sulfolobales archaeon]
MSKSGSLLSDVEDLGKNALRIYFKLFESETPLGVRELARDLNLPVSTVHYNLKRLESLGILSRSNNGYVVSRPIPLQGFFAIRNRLIPRMIIYSIFFLGFTIGSLTTIVTSGFSVDKLLAITVSSISSAIFFLEGLNMRRKLTK